MESKLSLEDVSELGGSKVRIEPYVIGIKRASAS